MKGFVDKNTCIGCGMCIGICPKIFVMDQDGLAKALEGEIPNSELDNAKDAELQCPVSAITIE